jgi:geranylgeranylglycerol-phosphate geranylgeranyltransferase
MSYTTYDKIKSLIISMRFKITPLGLLCVFVGGIVAGAPINSLDLFLAMLVTFFIGSGAQTFNDYFDWEIDKINHPERPIHKGILKPNEMLYFSIFLFTAGFVLSIFVNLLCVGIVIFSIIMLIVYEKYSKNIGITGNITVAFITALSFTYGGAAIGNPLASFILSLITFFIMVSREIIMDIRDSEGDKLFRKTLPIKIGKKPALYVACVFLFIAIASTPIPYLLNILNVWYMIIIIFVDIIALFIVFDVLKDIKNVARAASIIRVGFAIGLVAFILGAIH